MENVKEEALKLITQENEKQLVKEKYDNKTKEIENHRQLLIEQQNKLEHEAKLKEI